MVYASKKIIVMRSVLVIVGLVILSASDCTLPPAGLGSGVPDRDNRICQVQPTSSSLIQAGNARGGAVAVSVAPQFTLSSTSFADGAEIPTVHDAVDEASPGASPQLSWSNVPESTVELVVIARSVGFGMEYGSNDIVHWVLYDIPPSLTEIPQGMNVARVAGKNIVYGGVTIKQGEHQLKKIYVDDLGYASASSYGWVSALFSSAHPSGGCYNYEFTLYALNAEFTMPAYRETIPSYYNAIVGALAGKIIEQATFGAYSLKP